MLYVDVKTKIVTLSQRPLPLYDRELIVLINNLNACNRRQKRTLSFTQMVVLVA